MGTPTTADTESIDNRSSTSQPLPLHRHVQAAVSTHPRRSEASIQTAVGRARETRTLKRRLTGGATVGPLTVYYAPPSTPLRPSSSPSSVVNVGPPYPRILLPTLALSLPSIHIHTAMSDSNGTSTNLKRARSSSPVNGSTSPGGKKQNTGSASTKTETDDTEASKGDAAALKPAEGNMDATRTGSGSEAEQGKPSDDTASKAAASVADNSANPAP